MSLLGTWEQPIKGEQHLLLPPAFCEALDEGCFVTRGFDTCLHAFPRPSWRALSQRIVDLPLAMHASRQVRRLIFGSAVDLAVDSEGSISLPQQLRAYAGLTDRAIVVGLETYFEIWAPEHWEQALTQLNDATTHWAVADLPAALASF